MEVDLTLLHRLPLMLLTSVVVACATSRGPAPGSAGVSAQAGRQGKPNESRDSTVVHTAAGQLGPSSAVHDSIALSLRDIMNEAQSLFGESAAPAMASSHSAKVVNVAD